MKKIAIIFLSTFLMFSCSNDSTENGYEQELNNTTYSKGALFVYDEAYADSIFSNYVQSGIYLNLKVESDNYFSKFHDLSFFENINTGEEVFIWVSGNIDLTDFVNVDEAQAGWNHIGSLRGIALQAFPEIYEFILEAPQELVVESLDKWLGEPRQVTGNDNCDEELKRCEDFAWNSYRHSMLEHLGDAMAGNENAIVSLSLAEGHFLWQIQNCAYRFEDCIGL